MGRRFTPAGWVVLVALATATLMGPDSENNVSYQAFTFLFCLVVAGICFSWFYRGGFSATRLAPRYGTAGSALHYRIVVRNLTRQLQTGLTLLEDLEDPRPAFPEWHAKKLAEERRARPFRVSRLQHGIGFRTADVKEAAVAAVPPGQEVEVRMEMMPLRRGLIRFEGTTVARADAFGLFRAFSRVRQAQGILILPKRYPLPPIALPGTMRYQAGGIALASNVGQSDEFVSLRDYRHGDPIRHIHWRSWAKTGKPVIKEFEDEFFVRHALMLDTFTDQPDSEVFEEAVSVAASFACSVRTQESLLDLLFVGPESYCFTAGRGLARSDQMLEILAGVKPCRDRPFSQLRQLVIEHVRVVSGCICVFVEWERERQDLVERLRSLGVPLMVVLVVPPGRSREIEPGPMRDDPANFHVFETGQVESGLARMENSRA